MTRIINPHSAGKARNRLSRQVALSLRELAKRPTIDQETRDLLAFVVLALEDIAAGIDESVAAWEKRGYWVKADRFRLEWEWAGQTAARLRAALQAEDWDAIPMLLAEVGQRFAGIKISPNHRMGRPWQGAYRHFSAVSSGGGKSGSPPGR